MHKLIALCTLLLTVAGAHGACQPIRFGYTDQALPPYYMGSGGQAPVQHPGAALELVREIAASVGCDVVAVRLPAARLHGSLQSGQIDVAAVSSAVVGLPNFTMDRLAGPLDAHGQFDPSRGLQLLTVVFVRARDAVARDTDPTAYFRTRRLGVYHGAGIADALRQSGYEVDDGAVDSARNFDKLLLKRIDGYALSLTAPDDMDADVAARYGGNVVRLDQPIRTARIVLVFNQDYYERNRARAEAMWDWMGSHGKIHMARLLKNYQK